MLNGAYDSQKSALEKWLAEEEGYRKHIYLCSSGKRTIGYGLNLDAGLPEDEALMLMRLRLLKLDQELARRLPWYYSLDKVRRGALVAMAYQLGLGGLLGFKKMLVAIDVGDYARAATEALDSRWASQTPARAKRTAEKIRTGVGLQL